MDSKTLTLIATILFISSQILDSNINQTDDTQFQDFKTKFGKVYDSELEHSYRFSVYNTNMAEIAVHNAKEGITYTKGENQFTDYTQEEFEEIFLMTRIPNKPAGTEVTGMYTTGHVNWVEQGAVQNVKNQGYCGSCWAFSVASVTESQKFLQTGTLGEFSEQQLVSCDNSNYGCSGGWPAQALQYYVDNGICTESTYPYTSGNGYNDYCYESYCSKDSFKLNGWSYVSADKDSLKYANEQAPVSVAVDASNWGSYYSGIFSSCSDNLNHAVVLAGYQGDDYWLIRNSWGSSWGENGYIRLAGGYNTCGVYNAAVLPQ